MNSRTFHNLQLESEATYLYIKTPKHDLHQSSGTCNVRRVSEVNILANVQAPLFRQRKKLKSIEMLCTHISYYIFK